MKRHVFRNFDLVYEAVYNLLLWVELIVTPYQKRKGSKEVIMEEMTPRY
jgi:hypothetical protein